MGAGVVGASVATAAKVKTSIHKNVGLIKAAPDPSPSYLPWLSQSGGGHLTFPTRGSAPPLAPLFTYSCGR